MVARFGGNNGRSPAGARLDAFSIARVGHLVAVDKECFKRHGMDGQFIRRAGKAAVARRVAAHLEFSGRDEDHALRRWRGKQRRGREGRLGRGSGAAYFSLGCACGRGLSRCAGGEQEYEQKNLQEKAGGFHGVLSSWKTGAALEL